MSGWNYRVLRYSGGELGIHEVYYDDAGLPTSCTVGTVGLVGDDVDELHSGLLLMAKALEKPVLEYDSFGQNTHPWLAFLDARLEMMRTLRSEGKSIDQIAQTLTLTPSQARSIFLATDR